LDKPRHRCDVRIPGPLRQVAVTVPHSGASSSDPGWKDDPPATVLRSERWQGKHSLGRM
jgi:hypothetical protein